MDVAVGFTGLLTVVVNAASLYHVKVEPVAHVADKVLCAPEHIAAGLALAAVGADGVAVTVTVTFDVVVELLHIPLTHDA